jgi:hypothetical protein
LTTKEDKSVGDTIGALKWCIGGMLTNREHLSFLR